MKELELILRQHAARYPHMEPTDGVKLLYQNEFGGGHLLRDEEAALRYLRREYEAAEKNPRGNLTEEIGNGVFRIHLAALAEEDFEKLSPAFVSSARAHRGSLDSFRQKLDILRRLTAEGTFGFDSAALESYLRDYEAAGFPMVSHSAAYRDAYRPAYRIVREEFWV